MKIKKNDGQKSNHFLEFHDTEQIAFSQFVHDDDVFGLHAQYRSFKSTHPNGG